MANPCSFFFDFNDFFLPMRSLLLIINTSHYGKDTDKIPHLKLKKDHFSGCKINYKSPVKTSICLFLLLYPYRKDF